jgi:ubiquinone/menaquinone biosynthesis C-methylase UbiE
MMNNTIDYGEIWKTMMTESKKTNFESDRFWTTEEAVKYDTQIKMDNWSFSRNLIKRIDFTPDSKILDIGSGPGTLTIPLAGMVKHVTAVEPSDGMLYCLKENIKAIGLNNVSWVQKKWEDVDLKDLNAPYDVVVASFSLAMPDIREAVIKMNDVSSKYVYLNWFAGMPSWEKTYAEAWQRVHGTSYNIHPQIDCIYKVLYDMGIYPNVTVYPDYWELVYPGMEAAVTHYRRIVNATTAEHDAILQKYISEAFSCENGSIRMKEKSYTAWLWWEKS